MYGVRPGRPAAARVSNDGGPRLALGPERVGDPDEVIILRAAPPGVGDPRVSAGDLLVADRRVKPEDGSLVVVSIDGERSVARLRISGGREHLCRGREPRVPVGTRRGARVRILATVVSVIPVIPES